MYFSLISPIRGEARGKMTLFSSYSRTSCICIVVLLLGILSNGCATWNPRGPGFGTDDATWGQRLRPASRPGNAVGLDSRAREIERSLGVP